MTAPGPSASQADALDGRVRLFDTLRGFSVVSMVLFHLYYDLVFIVGVVPSKLFFTPVVDVWRASISWTFLFIAGAMCTFSRNNLKRSGVYLAVALAIYLVTSHIDKSIEISFGIIYCMGFCTLAVALLIRAGFSPKSRGWTIAFLMCFALLLTISNGTISLFGADIVRIPQAIYEGGALSWLGLPGIDFMSADYYAPLPYLFLYLSGWSCALRWREEGYAHPLWRFSIRPLERIGAYALPIYVAHQPVLLILSRIIAIAVGL